MKIGVPKERKTLEKRVALTPDGAYELVKLGHEVLIEKDAGLGSFFSNESYKEAGCILASSLKEVWNKSELVVKVKEPLESEYEFFRSDLAVFTYLHLASMPDVTYALLDGKVTGIAYELVQTADRRLPLLEPMSEVAGKMSVLNGSYFLLAQNGGRGVLLGGTVGVPPGDVVIVGAGIAGRAACGSALGLGARVTVLDISYAQLEKIKIEFGSQVRTAHSTKTSLERECERADLLIGAVLVPGAKAPKVITREMIRSMGAGTVFVDISIDQGGCSETIRLTTLKDPVYEEEGVIHYGVPNMPSQTGRTSTKALSVVTLPYILKIANMGVKESLLRYQELQGALCTFNGLLTNKAVSDAVAATYTPVEEALGA